MAPLLLDETNAIFTALRLVKYAGMLLLLLLGVPMVLLAKKALSQNSSAKGAGFALLLFVLCGIAFLVTGFVVFIAYGATRES